MIPSFADRPVSEFLKTRKIGRARPRAVEIDARSFIPLAVRDETSERGGVSPMALTLDRNRKPAGTR